MNKEAEIQLLIENSSDEYINNYTDKVYENYKELGKKEEKHNLWLVIIILLYMIIDNSSISSVNIGPININDISVVSKLLPIILIYILFNLISITDHKKDLLITLKTISNLRSNKTLKEIDFSLRMYLPYMFSNSIRKLTTSKPHIITSLIGFSLLLPIIIVALTPYVIIVLMLIDIYNKHMNDFLGYLSFYITLWSLFLFVFYIIVGAINSTKQKTP